MSGFGMNFVFRVWMRRERGAVFKLFFGGWCWCRDTFCRCTSESGIFCMKNVQGF